MTFFSRKLILFGLMKGYLRKVNKYPISLAENLLASNETSKKWLTGNFNYDKICSSLGFDLTIFLIRVLTWMFFLLFLCLSVCHRHSTSDKIYLEAGFC